MKKILSAAIVSATVLTGLGINQADAASGNTIQSVQQIHQGDQSLEGVKLGQNIQDILKHKNLLGIPINLIILNTITSSRLLKV